MRITASQLRKVINEEVSNFLQEAPRAARATKRMSPKAAPPGVTVVPVDSNTDFVVEKTPTGFFATLVTDEEGISPKQSGGGVRTYWVAQGPRGKMSPTVDGAIELVKGVIDNEVVKLESEMKKLRLLKKALDA